MINEAERRNLISAIDSTKAYLYSIAPKHKSQIDAISRLSYEVGYMEGIYLNGGEIETEDIDTDEKLKPRPRKKPKPYKHAHRILLETRSFDRISEMTAVPIHRDKLKAERKKFKLKQRDLTERCGVAQSSICWIEKGYKDPSVRVLRLLCRALDLEVNDIIDWKELKKRVEDKS